MSERTEPEALPQVPETDRKRLVKLMRRISWRNDLHCVIDAKAGAVRSRGEAVSLLLRVLENSIEPNWRQRTAAIIALRYLPVPPENSAEAANVLGKIMLGSDTKIGQRVIMRGLWIVPRWLAALIPLLLMGALLLCLPPDAMGGGNRSLF